MNTALEQNVETIWKEYHHKLFGFIRKRVNDKFIAEDILQDVFIKILNKIDTLREDSKIQNWLYQLTRNAIIDYYRVNKIKEGFPYPHSDMANFIADGHVEYQQSTPLK